MTCGRRDTLVCLLSSNLESERQKAVDRKRREREADDQGIDIYPLLVCLL